MPPTGLEFAALALLVFFFIAMFADNGHSRENWDGRDWHDEEGEE